MPNEAEGSLDKSDAPYKVQGHERKVNNYHSYMLLKKAIQDLINYSE